MSPNGPFFDVFASWVTSASGRSGHWSADRVEFWANAVGAAPPTRRVALYLAAKRSLDRARKRSRPVPVTIAPKNGGHTARLLPSRKQSGLEPLSRPHAAPWQPHQLISGRAPVARTKILHTRGSSAPRWMGLVSRTADKANPASSVTHPSRLWPGSVGQIQSTR